MYQKPRPGRSGDEVRQGLRRCRSKRTPLRATPVTEIARPGRTRAGCKYLSSDGSIVRFGFTCQRIGFRQGQVRKSGPTHVIHSCHKSKIQARAFPSSCCMYVASTCAIVRTFGEFPCKIRHDRQDMQGSEIKARTLAKGLGLLCFSGSGGGTRTPDTRIMIPLL